MLARGIPPPLVYGSDRISCHPRVRIHSQVKGYHPENGFRISIPARALASVEVRRRSTGPITNHTPTSAPRRLTYMLHKRTHQHPNPPSHTRTQGVQMKEPGVTPEEALRAVERVHDPSYVAEIRQLSQRGGGFIDHDTCTCGPACGPAYACASCVRFGHDPPHQPSTINHQPSTINHQPSTAGLTRQTNPSTPHPTPSNHRHQQTPTTPHTTPASSRAPPGWTRHGTPCSGTAVTIITTTARAGPPSRWRVHRATTPRGTRPAGFASSTTASPRRRTRWRSWAAAAWPSWTGG